MELGEISIYAGRAKDAHLVVGERDRSDLEIFLGTLIFEFLGLWKHEMTERRNLMKRTTAFILIVCMSLSLTGCYSGVVKDSLEEYIAQISLYEGVAKHIIMS